MPSISDFAALSNEVYKDFPKTVGGWTVDIFRAKWLSGELQAAVFSQNQVSIVAFKGTSGPMDVLADAKLGFCVNTSYYRKAEEFVSHHAPADAYLTGHSLGGAIAQAVGHRRGMPFVTFNAPGTALIPTFNTGSVMRNLSQLNPIMGAGRLLGAAYGRVRHSNQTKRDQGAMGSRDHGVNYRLAYDQVSNFGIHRGKVITLSGKAYKPDPLSRHSMGNVIAELTRSGVGAHQFH